MARLLAPTLQKLIDANATTAKDLGEMAGVSSSTIYRWINGESEPDFDSIRLILHHLPDPNAQLAILTAFIAGTPWTVTQSCLPRCVLLLSCVRTWAQLPLWMRVESLCTL